MRWLAILVAAACGSPTMSPRTSVDLHVDATLAKPDGGCARSDATAQLLIQGLETTPCPLSVSAMPVSFAASGVCTGVPTGTTRTLTLQWLEPGSGWLLAESIGRADLGSPAGDTVTISFAGIATKTSGLPTETLVEQIRFNCDRSGYNACDGGVGDGGTAEIDSCSNYEEYCAGTIDEAAVNTCP
jgi:hypothetical protein